MGKCVWDFALPESFLRMQEIVNKLQLSNSALATSEAWKAAIPNYEFNGISAALERYADITGSFSNMISLKKSNLEATALINILQKVEMSNISASVLPLIDTSVHVFLKDAIAMKAAFADVDWSWLVNEYTSYVKETKGENSGNHNTPAIVTEEAITPEIRAEIAEDITQVLSNPELMQTTSQSKYLQWKERNPGLAAFYLEVLIPIITLILTLMQVGITIWQARLTKNSRVYEEPSSTANVVYNITVDQQVTVIQLVEEEKRLLTEIATGKSFKDESVEEEYQKRHRHLCSLASKAGFEYPISSTSLAEWWIEIRDIGGYSERRAHISRMFAPLLNLLNESDDSEDVNFSRIASRSGAVHKSIEDALVFIREGKYDSAVDRVHTAFHGYLRQLLNEHSAYYTVDESLPALYAKLHVYYESHIQPADVGERVKMILRSAGGMVNAVNELRNNNTVAHPNGQLIQKRESQLVIRLVNAIIDYIEDIEKSME